MYQPTLVIAIPTWNRAAYLEENLTLLCNEIKNQSLENSIGVFVSDNASDDHTADVCENFKKKYAFFDFHTQPENLGANANFATAIQKSNGEYAWLFGDDDLIVPEALNKLLEDIKQYKPDILTGASVYAETQKKATCVDIHDKHFGDRELLKNFSMMDIASKISGLIFRRESALPVIEATDLIIKETRTPWPHLAWFLLVLNNRENKLLILPYGLNQLLAENWDNLLFNGKLLVQIHFIDYQILLTALQQKLDKQFCADLTYSLVITRKAALVKCLLYASYLDGYWGFIKISFAALCRVKGAANRFCIALLLCVSSLIPPVLRRCGFGLLACLFSRSHAKLALTIKRLKQTKKNMQEKKTKSAERNFNPEGL